MCSALWLPPSLQLLSYQTMGCTACPRPAQELCLDYHPMHELSLMVEPHRIACGELWQLPPPKVGGCLLGSEEKSGPWSRLIGCAQWGVHCAKAGWLRPCRLQLGHDTRRKS